MEVDDESMFLPQSFLKVLSFLFSFSKRLGDLPSPHKASPVKNFFFSNEGVFEVGEKVVY